MTNESSSTAGEVQSAAALLKDFDAMDTAKPLTFFVGWLSGKSYQLRRLNLHDDVEREFRGIARGVLEGTEGVKGLQERESEAWAPDAQIFPETYLECPSGDVGDSPKLTNRPKDERLLDALQAAEDLLVMDAKDIEAKNLSLYGFAIGSPGNRTVFIRRANPRRGLRRGKFLGRYSDTLQRVDDPVFAFDGLIDLVFVGERLVILSQNAFSMIFRDQADMRALVRNWGNTLSSHFPVEKKSLSRLTSKADRDSRRRQRLESIVSRGHLNGLSGEQLKEAMEACELDPSKFFTSKGELCVEDGDEADLLYFLNEDLYQGLISGDRFRADKKASRA